MQNAERSPGTLCSVLIGTVVLGCATTARAVPWVLFVDAESASICDVVNAANAELVVLDTTGELVIVSGIDPEPLFDTFVDDEGLVFFGGLPAGFIEFAEDGDGFRTLWWFVSVDDVANVNEFTGEPTATGALAFDFTDVPCDACEFWDDPADCADTDLDGVDDRFDDCLLTPLNEAADALGCSCSQLDDDADDVDNCFDLCPGTSLLDAVDIDGCAIVIIVEPPGSTTVIACGSFGAMILPVLLCGLVGLGPVGRRNWL